MAHIDAQSAAWFVFWMMVIIGVSLWHGSKEDDNE